MGHEFLLFVTLLLILLVLIPLLMFKVTNSAPFTILVNHYIPAKKLIACISNSVWLVKNKDNLKLSMRDRDIINKIKSTDQKGYNFCEIYFTDNNGYFRIEIPDDCNFITLSLFIDNELVAIRTIGVSETYNYWDDSFYDYFDQLCFLMMRLNTIRKKF